MPRTIIFIDGFNLYYSRLRGTPFKWLDIAALFRDEILRVQDPSSVVVGVRYFTAPIKASYATHGAVSEQAQTQYHRALMARHSGLLQVIQGFHTFEVATLPAYTPGTPANKSARSAVWMIEEKQTDVNLALAIYRAATRGECDQIVICSNDGDMEPALRLVREDATNVRIGLVLPLPEPVPGRARFPNKRLTAQAHWVRHHIRDDELARSQMPAQFPTRKKPAIKPAHW